MDDSLQETRNKDIQDSPKIPGVEEVLAICKLLEEHKGVNVTALDLRKLNLWTDFFVIATVSSSTHLQGLLRHIKDFAGDQGLNIRRRTQQEKNVLTDNSWNLVDMGTVVVHLMTAQSREFYELEVLWGSAGRVYPA
ncbi:MAG: ribosome silencing factor [Treponema sp.]|nr:ribosome silencing factor [Treponema sp.]